MPDLEQVAFDRAAAAANELAYACEIWLGDHHNGRDTEQQSFERLLTAAQQYTLAFQWEVHGPCGGYGCAGCDKGHVPALDDGETAA